jgi:hypothetical protein
MDGEEEISSEAPLRVSTLWKIPRLGNLQFNAANQRKSEQKALFPEQP